jgi:polyisoprenoid-binding protein YceI
MMKYLAAVALTVAIPFQPGLFAQAQAPAQAPVSSKPAAAGPDSWQIDAGHTSAQFSVKHLLVSTVRGTLGKVTGTIDYDGKNVQSVKADVSIDVAAIATGNESRDRDLRGEGFFEVTKYPAMTFKSKRVEPAGQGRFRLVGDLTMHGVTREVTLAVDGPSPILKQANGSEKIGASATATINRRDFNLQYNRMVEAAPVVSDEVQIQIDIEANRSPVVR